MSQPFNLRLLMCLTIVSILASPFLSRVSAAAEFWLRADTTSMTMPDGVVVPMWGYAEDLDQNFTTVDGAVSAPGPGIVVPPGDTTLIIHLQNNLPVPSSLMIAGQPEDGMTPTYLDGRVMSFGAEAAANGGEVVYTWSNLRPGTYLYSSGTNPAVQVQMGLYGSVIADLVPGPYCGPEPGGGEAYLGIVYDEDLTMVFSEIDPALHNAVAADDYGQGKSIESTIGYDPKYFLINGQAYEAGDVPMPVGTSGSRFMIRFINAGLRTVVPVIQGFYMNIVSEDGFPLPHPFKQYSLSLPAGKVFDAIFTLDCSQLPEPVRSTGEFVIFDRRGNLNNAGAGPGGMIANFALTDRDGESVVDICDNCLLDANEAQVDTDGDLFGNICDQDLNNDLFVDFADVTPMIRGFIWQEPNADFNSDGSVNFGDIQIFLNSYLTAPGPSGLLLNEASLNRSEEFGWN